ncbi:4-hydroxy-tetrahydrodipicolinate synthase [Thalassovita gelatinovora]|uniref:4-hydroxy-tetrahydrodipicolinate synthase n=1 Tax=Thalassovita gelatinovora TaxID=53501 RepID=A0A0P1G3L9_THAGE|nr:dihydrodipicolinate synthase family protein [Thalassovita gelatinovora]QIZ81626.1 dihydrodipicolinate synthase family protein [Thalassovita gelatinovora]CUH68093.1 4-hydroxy-tetrahydrodipicolinate synthase [Thalassovita gelatinovora]SEQ29064.1 4-hydroxy-tetrahydrodipicolinate synthase [Thalassovita gelatinovora]
MTKARRGIYAAAISPFGADGALDHAKLLNYCQHLLTDGGCDGVAPTGTTGEGTSVPMVDRLALPGVFAEAGIETDRVIFGTGAPSAQDCVALTKAACDAGYVNVLVLPPYYYKSPSDEGLFAYYANLVEKIGRDDLRIYLYHFPQMSQVPLSTDLVNRLRSEFGPVIAGLKDSSGDFEQSRAFVEATGGVAENFDVYPSSEAFLWDGLSIGTAGIISGSTNIFAPKVQIARHAAEGPERETAMQAVRAARAVAQKYPLMAAMKTAEAWRSGDDGWLRMAPPLLPLTPAQKDALKSDLAALVSTIEPAS